MNGFWPDLQHMTADGGLWRAQDAHCCPEGGSVHVELGVRDDRFVVRSFQISDQTLSERRAAEPAAPPPHAWAAALSASVMGGWTSHRDADGHLVLDLLALWREPAGLVAGMSWGLSAGVGNSVEVGMNRGPTIRINSSSRSIQVNGLPVWFADDNVVLLDLSGAGAPVVASMQKVDPRLAEPGNLPAEAPAELAPVFAASPDLRSFLRCAADMSFPKPILCR